jgi:hypothetical protein
MLLVAATYALGKWFLGYLSVFLRRFFGVEGTGRGGKGRNNEMVVRVTGLRPGFPTGDSQIRSKFTDILIALIGSEFS